MASSTIPKGSTILVTGATGSVGSAVANEIAKAGYKVRAVVRNPEKGGFLKEALEERYGSDCVEITHVPDMAAMGALERPMTGRAAVAHVASDVTFGSDPNVVITGSVNLTKAVLEAAAETPSIKRVVYTSSQAVLPRHQEDVHITPDSWGSKGELTAVAWSEPYSQEKAPAIYCVSKIESEQACWAFMRERNPHFELNTVVPNALMGEFVSPKLVSSLNGLLIGMWHGDQRAKEFLGMLGAQRVFNLEDSALTHLAALTMEDVKGERLLGLGEDFNLDQMVDIMQKLDPERKLPAKSGKNEKVTATVDMSRTEELIGRLGKKGLTGVEESVRQAVTSI